MGDSMVKTSDAFRLRIYYVDSSSASRKICVHYKHMLKFERVWLYKSNIPMMCGSKRYGDYTMLARMGKQG